jgi:hypothetical protein
LIFIKNYDIIYIEIRKGIKKNMNDFQIEDYIALYGIPNVEELMEECNYGEEERYENVQKES